MTVGRLLVVDDQPAFGSFVARVARELGYEVKVTTHGDEFIAAYPEFAPDLIVLDVVMPDRDGIELIRWLAAQHCRARIIVATGYNPSYARMTKLIGTALGDLSITTLAKPVPVATLRAALDPALNAPQAPKPEA
jgi:two-component system OmpR family response regulator